MHHVTCVLFSVAFSVLILLGQPILLRAGSRSHNLPVSLVGDAAIAADVNVVVGHADELGGREGLGGEPRVEVADRVTPQRHVGI